jgi:hypothetical protein
MRPSNRCDLGTENVSPPADRPKETRHLHGRHCTRSCTIHSLPGHDKTMTSSEPGEWGVHQTPAGYMSKVSLGMDSLLVYHWGSRSRGVGAQIGTVESMQGALTQLSKVAPPSGMQSLSAASLASTAGLVATEAVIRWISLTCRKQTPRPLNLAIKERNMSPRRMLSGSRKYEPRS